MIEVYKIQASKCTKHEMEIQCRLLDDTGFETRAAGLARAMRGRYAIERKVFYITPEKARDFELLFHAGFVAWRVRNKKGVMDWRYLIDGLKKKFDRKTALVIARVIKQRRVAA